MNRADFLSAHRREAWAAGRDLADSLLTEYGAKYELQILPPPAQIVDELLTEFLGCELARAPLGQNVFAQTEWFDDATIVTVNSQTANMTGVRDVQGVENVAKWHECIHVTKDKPSGALSQLWLEGFATSERVVCRRGRQTDHSAEVAAREFWAEEAGRAAAVSLKHLRRSESFLHLIDGNGRLANSEAWTYLYQAASDIGVNISALVTQLEAEALIVVERRDGRNVVHVQPSLASLVEAVQ